MRLIVVLIGAAMLLGACSKPMEVESITSIKPLNGSSGLDVYAEQRRRGEKVPEFAGEQLLQVRTYRATEDGFKGKEFRGAKCSVLASNFTGEATTPAKIRVPIYRGKSSPLAISCNHPDYKRKSTEVTVFNKTRAQRLQAGSSGGLAGVLVMAAVNGMSDPTKDEYSYSTAQIIMTPLPKLKRRK